MIKTGIITDEVSSDIRVAAAFAMRHGMSFADIRSSENKGAFDLTKEDWEYLSAVCADHGLMIRCIDAPLFKCSFADRETAAFHVSAFRRLAEQAARIGCGMIRGFDFFAEDIGREQRAEAFLPIIETCRETGTVCVLESDPSVHSSTATELLALLKTIESPYLKALFDPGNAFWVNPDADCMSDYELLRGCTRHIHLKDAVIRNGKTEAVCIGSGLAGYEKLLRRLAEDYDGGIAIETHYRKTGALNENQLLMPGGSGFSDGAYEASEECADALNLLLMKG